MGCGGTTYDSTAEEAGTGQGLASLTYWASSGPVKGLSLEKGR